MSQCFKLKQFLILSLSLALIMPNHNRKLNGDLMVEKSRLIYMTDNEGPRRSARAGRGNEQCDQIGRFIGLWATFQNLWQQLICPNLPHSQAIFVKVSKSIIFSEIIFGQLLQTFGDFFLVSLVMSRSCRGRCYKTKKGPAPKKLFFLLNYGQIVVIYKSRQIYLNFLFKILL